MAANALAETTGPLIPVGLSMGGIVALDILRQAPGRVTAVALFDTDCGADTLARRRNRDAQILMAVHGDFLKMVDTQLLPNYFSTNTEHETKTLQLLGDTVKTMAINLGVARLAAQFSALATRKDSWPMLETIIVPVLIACGSEDRICTPDSHLKMASVVLSATLECIEGAGHLSPLEQPTQTTRVLRSWLATLKY